MRRRKGKVISTAKYLRMPRFWKRRLAFFVHMELGRCCHGLRKRHGWRDDGREMDGRQRLHRERDFSQRQTLQDSRDIAFEYDRADFKKPWSIHATSSRAIELEFVPFYDRHAKSNLILLYSDVHQMLGRYNGTIRVGRNAYNVKNAVGWAEDHIARW